MNDCTNPQDHGRGKLTQVACAFIADLAASQEGARSSMAVELNERLAVWPRCRRNPDDEPLFPRGADALFTCGAPQSMSSTATTRRLEAEEPLEPGLAALPRLPRPPEMPDRSAVVTARARPPPSDSAEPDFWPKARSPCRLLAFAPGPLPTPRPPVPAPPTVAVAAVGAPAALAACRGNVGLARTGRGGHGADGADSVAMRTPALNESAGD